VGSSEAIRRFDTEALGWLAAFEAKYSRFLPDSWISVLNASAGGAAVASDPEIDRILALCHEMHFLTRGVFDPTALPLIRLWDWRRAQIPTDAEIEAARQCVGWRKVQRRPGSVRLSEPGMCLDLGGMGVTVDHTPGHTPGSVVFRVSHHDQALAFTGDTLFKQSVGRTDLPGGSGRDLLNSIVTKLLVLDDETRVLPGHGESSTIGFERHANPFLEGLTL
jgi:hypothetical protein